LHLTVSTGSTKALQAFRDEEQSGREWVLAIAVAITITFAVAESSTRSNTLG
jgi:hypothetical protein